MQNKITSVSKTAQEQKKDQLDGTIKLVDPLKKAIEKISKVEDDVVGLTPYPSSESLREFGLEEIDLGQYWYYAVKPEQIKKKMDQATKAFHEKDDYYQDSKLYDSFYAEYTKHIEKLQKQLESINEIRQMGICGTRTTWTSWTARTGWKGWPGWTNTSATLRNDKCPRSGTHSFRYYRLGKLI